MNLAQLVENVLPLFWSFLQIYHNNGDSSMELAPFLYNFCSYFRASSKYTSLIMKLAPSVKKKLPDSEAALKKKQNNGASSKGMKLAP